MQSRSNFGIYRRDAETSFVEAELRLRLWKQDLSFSKADSSITVPDL